MAYDGGFMLAPDPLGLSPRPNICALRDHLPLFTVQVSIEGIRWPWLQLSEDRQGLIIETPVLPQFYPLHTGAEVPNSESLRVLSFQAIADERLQR